MNLEETRQALKEYFELYLADPKQYMPAYDEIQSVARILENFFLGYIESGGTNYDLLSRTMALYEKLPFGDQIKNFGIRNYLSGHGSVFESNLNVSEALKQNEDLSLEQLRTMIARRFCSWAASPVRPDIHKLQMLYGFAICGGTLSDITESQDEDDKKIAKSIQDFLNRLNSESRYELYQMFNKNAKNRNQLEMDKSSPHYNN